MQLSFGTGALYGERNDLIGSGIGPRQFGVAQKIDISFDWTEKELVGQFQFPVAIARGQAKITGKCSFAQILGNVFGDIFFGLTPTVGQFGVSELEAGTIPASPPYTITVGNAANYNDDLGVRYFTTGGRFNRVTTPSTAGQYSVNFSTGVYTFSAADTGAAVLISYAYNITTSGTKITITNQALGLTPTFKGTFYQGVSPGPPGTGLTTKGLSLRLNVCTASKLGLSTGVDTFTLPELDFQAFADASGTIGYLSTVE